MNNEVLSDKYTKVVVLDLKTGEELAVITNRLIITVRDTIVVKLTPTDKLKPDENPADTSNVRKEDLK